MHTAEAVTENSESSAPAAPSSPANDRSPFNFVNSTSPALAMESEQHTHSRSTCFFSSDGANPKDDFGKRGTGSLA